MSTLIVFYDEEKWRRTRAKSPAGSAKIDEYGEKRKGRDDGGEGLIGDVRRFLYHQQSDADNRQRHAGVAEHEIGGDQFGAAVVRRNLVDELQATPVPEGDNQRRRHQRQ
jgi:hypothetical protein